MPKHPSLHESRSHADSSIAGLMAGKSNAQPKEWQCSYCTFLNDPSIAKCSVCDTGENPNPVVPKISNPDRKFSTLPDMTLSSQRMRDTRYQSTKEDFETAALLISSGENVSSETFTVLRIVTRKLLRKDMKYRTLDTTLPRVQQGLLGYEGVLEFLQKLGFRADESMTKLCIEPDQPPESVIHSALSVIEDKIRIFQHRNEARQVMRRIKREGQVDRVTGAE